MFMLCFLFNLFTIPLLDLSSMIPFSIKSIDSILIFSINDRKNDGTVKPMDVELPGYMGPLLLLYLNPLSLQVIPHLPLRLTLVLLVHLYLIPLLLHQHLHLHLLLLLQLSLSLIRGMKCGPSGSMR